MDRRRFIERFASNGVRLNTRLRVLRFETAPRDIRALEAWHVHIAKEPRDFDDRNVYYSSFIRYEWSRTSACAPWVFDTGPSTDYLRYRLPENTHIYSFHNAPPH